MRTKLEENCEDERICLKERKRQENDISFHAENRKCSAEGVSI
jgi:hypothetical protein